MHLVRYTDNIRMILSRNVHSVKANNMQQSLNEFSSSAVPARLREQVAEQSQHWWRGGVEYRVTQRAYLPPFQPLAAHSIMHHAPLLGSFALYALLECVHKMYSGPLGSLMSYLCQFTFMVHASP